MLELLFQHAYSRLNQYKTLVSLIGNNQ